MMPKSTITLSEQGTSRTGYCFAEQFLTVIKSHPFFSEYFSEILFNTALTINNCAYLNSRFLDIVHYTKKIMFVCPDKRAAIIVSKTVIQKFIYSNYC